ncbi:MAG: FtsX-like permease family protein [Acidimicrobiales bacterium]
MFRLAIKSALAKKRRLFGTTLSVLLGVAFLSGTLVFTDTIKATFDDLFADIYAETDTVVRAESSVESSTAAEARGRIPGYVLDSVAAVRGVAEAQGYVAGFAQLIGSDGEPIGNPARGAPTLGMSYGGGPALNPWKLLEGGRAPGPGELVIDAGSAKAGHLGVGDRVTVLTQTGSHAFPLVGVVTFGSIDSPGGASVALWDLSTTQLVMLGGADELDAVWVDAEPRVSQADLTARIAAAIPPGTEAVTGRQITEENQDAMASALGFFNTFLLVFAAIGLVVACFTIYNTFQIIVSQRAREMALLRAVGASRAQVLSSQLLEALIVGVVASIAGLLAGVGVATALKALLGVVGIDIPAGGTVFLPRTAVVALVVGVVVTVGSAVLPALRASRVPPIAAIRDLGAPAGGHPHRSRLVRGGLVVVAGGAAFAAGLAGSGVLWVGIGALLVFVGAFALSPLIARPVARVLGWPATQISGVTGVVARENAIRNPKRTARAGGALMVGVALVAAITVIAATAKAWTRDVVSEQFQGDFVVAAGGMAFGGLSPDVAAQLAALPEVGVATGVRAGSADDRSGGGAISYVAIDPRTAGRLFDLKMVHGSVGDLGDDGILVQDDVARHRHLSVGDTIDLGLLDGDVREVEVQGTYREDDLAGDYVVSHGLHEASGADQFDFSVFVSRADGVDEATARRAIERVTDRFPNADVQSRSEYVEDQARQIDQLVNLMYGLLGLAVLIALLSIANSISLSIHERTRELGLLRAVGMTRHQVATMIRWEAAIVACLGTATGAVLGVVFGWAISVTLRGDGLTEFDLPLRSIVVIVGISVAGGVLASIRPAWRASHLDTLRSIASE